MPRTVSPAREAPLDEGDVDLVSGLLRHGLAELDELQVIEQSQKRRLTKVGELDLAAFAAGEIEACDFYLGHQSASSSFLTWSKLNTGPSMQTYLSLIWQ